MPSVSVSLSVSREAGCWILCLLVICILIACCVLSKMYCVHPKMMSLQASGVYSLLLRTLKWCRYRVLRQMPDLMPRQGS